MLLSASGQVRSVGTLIPSEMALHPFNLAESCAFVRLDSDKSDSALMETMTNLQCVLFVMIRIIYFSCKNNWLLV